MLLGKYLNKYYIKFIIPYLIGLIGLIVVDYVQTLVPEYLGDIVGIVNSDVIDKNHLFSIIISLIVVAFGMFLGRMSWRLAIFNGSQKVEASLRTEMFLKGERLSSRYFHENNVGTIMAWYTTDLETIEEFLGWGTIMLVDAFFLSIIVIIKMIGLDFVLTIIALIPMLLIVLWGMIVEKFMSIKWQLRQKESDRLYDFSQESFSGIRVVKAFVKGTNQIKAFSKIAKSNKDVNVSFAKFSILSNVLIHLLITTIMAILLGFGGYFAYNYAVGNPIVVFNHKIELAPEKLVTFLGYFETLCWPMMALGQIVAMRSRAKASLMRITRFLDEEEEISDKENSVDLENCKGEIEFKNFSFKYPNTNSYVLKDVNIKINAGETIGIVGKIGSGKTSLITSLLRLYNVDDNTLFIDGNDIMSYTIKSVRESIAVVPQDNFLFSDSIKNNIALSNKDAEMDLIVKASKFADVDENISGFKDGYETIMGERGVTLSGGQKQRISIARAYLKNAPILILDDSVSAVDVKTEETILDNIKKYRSGNTTLVISSRVSTVSHMDRILVLNNGEVEGFDTHENLINISKTYQTMVHLQKLDDELHKEVA